MPKQSTTVLPHRAPLSAVVFEKTSVNVLTPVLVISIMATIVLAFWLIFDAAVADYAINTWQWFATPLAAFPTAYMLLGEWQHKRVGISYNSNTAKAAQAYRELNKDHKKLARPVLDRMLEDCREANGDDYYDSNSRKRLDAIYALRAKEARQKEQAKQTKDDSDLAALTAYLEDKDLNKPLEIGINGDYSREGRG